MSKITAKKMETFRYAYALAQGPNTRYTLARAKDAGVLELYLDLRQRMSAKLIRRKTKERRMPPFPGAGNGG